MEHMLSLIGSLYLGRICVSSFKRFGFYFLKLKQKDLKESIG